MAMSKREGEIPAAAAADGEWIKLSSFLSR